MMDELKNNSDQSEGTWFALRKFTSARIGLSKVGTSISSKSLLDFKLDHAHARDAVYSTLNIDFLFASLEKFEVEVFRVHSSVQNREEYLQRPDFGRRLNDASKVELSFATEKEFDISIILADGLSAMAINENAMPLLTLLVPLLRSSGFTMSPITIIEQARVAIGDEIGAMLKANLSLVLIGERPGLTSPNSLGAYLTYKPRVGLTDESRNCVSNIRPGGLSFEEASEKIFYLIQESIKRKLSGVLLKDNSRLLH